MPRLRYWKDEWRGHGLRQGTKGAAPGGASLPAARSPFAVSHGALGPAGVHHAHGLSHSSFTGKMAPYLFLIPKRSVTA